MDDFAPLLSLAEAQHGVFRLDQLDAHELGVVLRRERRRGTVEMITPVVARLVGSTDTSDQRAMAAVLDVGVGAVVSHESAAQRWGLPGFEAEPWHVTARRTPLGRRSRLCHMHEPIVLLAHHVCLLERVPVTTPARTMFDLAGSRRVHPLRVARALDNAWAAGLVNWRTLNGCLTDLAKRGRPGIRLMRALLAERGPEYRPAATGLERRFEQLMREAGIEGFRRQINVGSTTEWIGRVDFVHDVSRVIVEVDHPRWHDPKSDARRDAELQGAGYLVVRVTDFDVWHRPVEMVTRVRSAIDCRSFLPMNQT